MNIFFVVSPYLINPMKSTRLKCISDVTRTKRPLGAVGKLKGHIHSSEPI